MFAASARRFTAASSSSSNSAGQLAAALNQQRGVHDRNKKAMELVAKGWSALQEVDRVIDYADRNDKRLIPLLRGAKENFELALEIDNMNTHARYWLGKMHFKYHVPGACKAVGAALLVEAANMGDSDAQYELGCRLRIENDYVQSDQQAFHYIEQAVDQLHPGALYLLGAVYLTGDCVKRDIASAMWCFHRASEKGHAGAAIAYGSLLMKGAEVPEVITRFNSAIATVVTVAEILKNNGLAVEKKIMTSTVDVRDDSRSRPIQKAKFEIILGKTDKFDELMAAAAEEREAAEAEEQS